MEEKDEWEDLVGKTIKSACSTYDGEGVHIECTDGTTFIVGISGAKLFFGEEDDS